MTSTPYLPAPTIERSVLNRLCEVLRPDLSRAAEIRDRARDLENAPISAGAEAEALERRLDDRAAGGVELAELPYHPHAHLGIAMNAVAPREPPRLHVPRPQHAPADGIG